MAVKQALCFLSKAPRAVPRTPLAASIRKEAAFIQPPPVVGARYIVRGPRNQREEERTEEARQMERSFTREWKVGDVYAPHDLSAAEARKWKAKKAPERDAFDVLSLNPLDCYKNFSIMSEYMTDLGRIRPRSQTGLRPVNQRRLAKAIRRAIALGLMPSVHRHPEILKKETERAKNQDRASY